MNSRRTGSEIRVLQISDPVLLQFAERTDYR